MKLVFPLFLIIAMFSCFYGQNKVSRRNLKSKPRPVKERIKIDQTKPTVYIDFIKVEEREPFDVGEPRERVYLKFVNNSKWSIYIPVFSYMDESKGNKFYYDVEVMNEQLQFNEVPQGYKETGDTIKGRSELKSGKSMNFSVPVNHLANNLAIRIYFIYDWVWKTYETIDTSKVPYPEIESSVYFTNSMLIGFLKEKNIKSN